ncbi:ABC transporter ATP-binding protein [Haloferax sp. wsp5]|nr:ABC transporter ATP-binding protein [Haloferax sp. wsp5]
MESTAISRARDLTKSYGDVRALDGVDLDVPEGSFFGLLGPNGAGKTTFINILVGLLSPDEGSIVLDGDEITGCRQTVVRRRHRPEPSGRQGIRGADGREHLRTVVLTEQGKTWSLLTMCRRQRTGGAQVNELLEKFRLGDAADTVAEELPHGDRKLLDVAMSFGLDPDYLLLDEPTSGVSTREKEYVIETMSRSAGRRA